MSDKTNNPKDKVQQLQRRLWTCAKQRPTRRFHALYDRICRSDVLQEAWRRVRKNGGAAGVDEQTLRDIEERGVEEFLNEIQKTLREGRYRPNAERPDTFKSPRNPPAVPDRANAVPT